ncbi:hypothetical protein H2198_007780 [Neophaeococcomyces mojaviensis]|uniref:Uncharacterized protein n=1 Tax=Neophaeococcomyces mojaviensis TaxID=3383035 RepID=A0ACC2ZZ54_9EURO|nr:hypothetical protein H2198_007780 [Knufia sp. JES_112]
MSAFAYLNPVKVSLASLQLQMLGNLTLWLLAILVVAGTVRSVLKVWNSPLRTVPGPLLARYTRLWYLWRVYKGQFHHDNIDLHKTYKSPIVRVAPNMYSITHPDKVVYGIGSQMPKSDWYSAWKHPDPDRFSLFPERNIKRHAETRRKFQAIYSLSSLVTYEKCVDDCNQIFDERLREAAQAQRDIDMAYWLRCYAFDVIGNITYSKRFGFLDSFQDIEGTINAINKVLTYGSVVGVYSWLHPFLFRIIEKFPSSGPAARIYLTKFVRERVALREVERANRALEAKGQKKQMADQDQAPRDFLDRMFDLYEDESKGVTKYHVFMIGQSNIVAGSDTTAIALNSILYHLMKNPEKLEKLRKEIELHVPDGLNGQKNLITFRQSQEMPYLKAVIKEALRMHPAPGLPLWREVTTTATQICGRVFSSGDVVGINPWVAHYDEEVWEGDATQFRPERWSEPVSTDIKGQDRLKRMEAHYMPVSISDSISI